MPRYSAIVATCLLAGCSAAANPEIDKQAVEQAVRAASAGVVAAEVAQNPTGATAFYTDDAIVHFASAPQVQGKAAIEKSYTDFFAMGVASMESTITKVDVSAGGDLAYEYGVNHFTFKANPGVVQVGKYLIVWKKVANEWKIAALAVTDDAPPPAPQPNK